VDYGWEVDKANKSMISQHVIEEIPYAPEQIMKLVKSGCVSQRLCKGPTVVAWDINFLALCYVLVVVVVPL
jgi:hypothetical protein